LPLRLWGYLLERFPPVAYTLLVFLFAGSLFALVAEVAGITVAIDVEIRAALVVLLVFFHLRIMDEHKDEAGDKASYPDRLLTRGVVTLPLLARCGFVAVVLQAVLSTSISMTACAAWLAALIFTLLMKMEFGIGDWLNRHLVIYALTHNPIVALLAVFLWAASGADWDWAFGLYVLAVSFGSLAFEVGRKIRNPDEEIAGVESYSSVLGRSRADLLLISVRWLATVSVMALAFYVENMVVVGLALILAVTVHVGLLRFARKAKVVEGVATVALLGDFLLVWGLAW
jgi:4-hydroxybenzoate polyprenyltransferase